MVILLDYVVEDPKKVYNQGLQFNLPLNVVINFFNYNLATKNYNNTLHRWIKYPHPIVRQLARSIYSKKTTNWLYQTFRRHNTRILKQKQQSTEQKKEYCLCIQMKLIARLSF